LLTISTLRRALTSLVLHSGMAMLVGAIAALVGLIPIGFVMTLIGLGEFRGTDAWYSPVVWWPGFVFGLIAWRRTLDRATGFVWISGLLWLAFGIITMKFQRHGLEPWITRVRMNLFPLKKGECGMSECLYVLFYTWPAINSISYSIGAGLGFRAKGEASNNPEALAVKNNRE
jgi:hypothetical protein